MLEHGILAAGVLPDDGNVDIALAASVGVAPGVQHIHEQVQLHSHLSIQGLCEEWVRVPALQAACTQMFI